jgi:phage gp46-like protein
LSDELRLKQQFGGLIDAVTIDLLQLPTCLLDETKQLETALIVALGTDRLANPEDVLPDINSDDRRGWWGDLDADTIWGGWPIGSRLWLLERASILGPGAKQGSTVGRAETYTRECLQPFLTAGIASKMTVSASRTGTEAITVNAALYRGPKSAVSLTYQTLWDEIGQN